MFIAKISPGHITMDGVEEQYHAQPHPAHSDCALLSLKLVFID